MKIIVGCEESQIVMSAFLERGHDAWSCDLQETSGEHPDRHLQCDIMEILDDGWDLAIFHPTCTYLTNAANKWLFHDSANQTVGERWREREKAIDFFIKLQEANIEKIAIENPQPHPYVMEKVGRFTDKIQPWMFGDPETKGICWWLKNLPPLMSTVIESKREPLKHMLPPGPERAKLRSKFFPGVSAAMAEQWG